MASPADNENPITHPHLPYSRPYSDPSSLYPTYPSLALVRHSSTRRVTPSLALKYRFLPSLTNEIPLLHLSEQRIPLFLPHFTSLSLSIKIPQLVRLDSTHRVMKPIQSPPPQSPSSNHRHTNNSRPRRRPDLTLPLPQREPQLAVPLPLPPNSGGSSSSSFSSSSSSSSFSSSASAARAQLSFSELERKNRIGSGSGGTVYKVAHRPSNRFYALKVIYGHHDDSVRNQICREIEILRDVNHPNVVRCHDMFDHNGEIQVLLEFMDGGSLEGIHISDEAYLSDVARQILNGIAYLHRRKIVHRDIKPSNLLINSKKNVKIADFGVSRILAQTMDPCNSSVGTIAYMSPERINTDLNQGLYDGYAGDIWSLGVSILEFYLGRFPFGVGRQGDWASLMCAICMSQPPEAPANASGEFRNFIACCLQREPARRWTANQLLQHPFIARRGGGGGGEGTGGNATHSLMLPPPPRPIA